MLLKSDKKKPILECLSRLCVFTQLLFFVFLVLPWYTSADSRYLRDNFQYLTERYAEIGKGKAVDTHGINTLLYPTPVALKYLYMLENDWIGVYLKDDMATEELNPWDAITRLQLQANDTYVQNVYDSIVWDMAFFQDDNIKKQEMMSIWASDRTKNQESAITAVNNLMEEFKSTMIIFIVMEIPTAASLFYLIFITKFFKHIKNGQNNVLKQEVKKK